MAILLVQLLVIIITVRVFSFAFRKAGQPGVIGEIIAGIVLGPSVLGSFFPAAKALLFPPESIPHLQLLSQIGLILFMFIIGMELDLELLRKKAGALLFISYSSIFIPFLLGAGLAWYLYPEFSGPGKPFYVFALFSGISLSITAFPVLARILREKMLMKTPSGILAMAAAAIGDVTAWILLAVIVALAKSDSLKSALLMIGGLVLFCALLLLVIKPLLRKWWAGKNAGQEQTAIALILLLLSACVCEWLGVHALFGAFLAGVAMPVTNIRPLLIARLEDVALLLFLPLFFVCTGLNTRIGSLDSTHLWMVCLLIVITAVAGKLGGTALAAIAVKEDRKTALTIGVLMNTRGLMELVVLNVGYDLGIITQQLFTIMVIMAILTTLMTAPVLKLLRVLPVKRTVQP